MPVLCVKSSERPWPVYEVILVGGGGGVFAVTVIRVLLFVLMRIC